MERYYYLLNLVKQADEDYHVHDKPTMTDAQYDAARIELNHLAEKYNLPKYEKVGHSIIPMASLKIHHDVPMMSLANVFTEDEFLAFYQKVSPCVLIVDEKIDGLSLSLKYHKGRLSSAGTRGDGDIGENVTANAYQIDDIPVVLNGDFPDNIEIRGEVYLTFKAFEELNSKLPDKDKFATPRNAAAGSLRQKDPMVTKSRNLSFIMHGVVGGDEMFSTPYDALVTARESWGFKTGDNFTVATSEYEALEIYDKIEKSRDILPYPIDGVVFKVNSFGKRKDLGNTSHSPRWAAAFKFTAEKEITTITNIVTQVGRTGKITPVAELAPVMIGGACISRVTLHNKDEILRLRINIGDQVEVERAGDVIPRIIRNLSYSEDKSVFTLPTECPSCGGILTYRQDVADIYCMHNKRNCRNQMIEQLCHFVSRKALDIKGIGKQILVDLFDTGAIRTSVDLYKLDDVTVLRNVSGYTRQSVIRIKEAMLSSKRPLSYRLLYALGIDDVGEVTSMILMDHFQSIPKLVEACLTWTLPPIKGIGPVTVLSLCRYFNDEENRKMVQELIEILEPIEEAKFEPVGPLSGKTVCVTGSFEGMSRKGIHAKLKQDGAIISDRVTNKVDILFVGGNPGSKLKEATDAGIEIRYSL